MILFVKSKIVHLWCMFYSWNIYIVHEVPQYLHIYTIKVVKLKTPAAGGGAKYDICHPSWWRRLPKYKYLVRSFDRISDPAISRISNTEHTRPWLWLPSAADSHRRYISDFSFHNAGLRLCVMTGCGHRGKQYLQAGSRVLITVTAPPPALRLHCAPS